MRFDTPPKKRAGAKAIDLCAERATRRGRRVPRSPREPEISSVVRFAYIEIRRRLNRDIIIGIPEVFGLIYSF
jgi:hypothetical protein